MAAPTIGTTRPSSSKFYIAMALTIAAIVFAGFSRTYYLRSFYRSSSLPFLLHVHGFVFTAWLLLLFVQTSLVAVGRTDIHRRLGVFGGVLAAVMIVVGYATAIHGARRDVVLIGNPGLAFLVIPFGDLLNFATLVGAALLYRRKPEIHKRLMLCATIAILAPALGRLPFILGRFIRQSNPLVASGLADLGFVACILYDWVSRKRVHPAYIWGGLFVVLTQVLRAALAGTAFWLSFTRWLIR
jgi:hypothetical protein